MISLKSPDFHKIKFKLPEKQEYSHSFINVISKEQKKVDHRCMIVENFKGYSESAKIEDFIPCIFLRNPNKTKKILVYFHGNSEDLGGAYQFLQFMQYRIETHIIAVEYPGYGVYKGTATEESVFNDAHRVLEFIQKVLRYRTQDIIVIGRSIGTGPA